MTACSPNCTNRPDADSNTNRLPSWDSREKPAHHDKSKEPDHGQADNKPKFFTCDGEHKIRMRIGQYVFYCSFARTTAPKTAIGKGFQRTVDLVTITRRGI